jgi:hypothetical protein
VGSLDSLRRQLTAQARTLAPRVSDGWTQSVRSAESSVTGRMRAATTTTAQVLPRRIVWTLEVDTPYAEPAIRGARPHLIVGKPLLVFFWPKAGRTVFFRKVNHPGNPPNRATVRAIDDGVAILRRVWGRI